MATESEIQVEQEIQSLWERRASLSRRESDRLYRLVSSVLKRMSLPHYATLKRYIRHHSWDDLKSQLIDDFYTDVVYCRALNDTFQETALNHRGALLTYYRNYLIDRIRRCQPERNLEAALREVYDQVQGTARPETGGVDPAEGSLSDELLDDVDRYPDDSQESETSSDFDTLADSSAAETLEAQGTSSIDHGRLDRGDDEKKQRRPSVDTHCYQNLTRSLDPFGADQALEDAEWARALLPEANAFLDRAERERRARDEPPWVLLYLAYHFCQEDPEARLSMVTLRDRYGIRNHHSKAQRLGITWVRSGFASVDAFGQTLLGQWLQSLGLAITRENLAEIRAALKILCQAALKQVKAVDIP